jgi:hypothetical protein
MPVSDNSKVDASLTATLSELESLLGDRQDRVPDDTAGLAAPSGEIPILDELVEADDVDINEWGQHLELPAAAANQMLHLIDTIERRLTEELEALVQTMKTTMKSSIIQEVKSRLDAPVHQGETSARPAEPDAAIIVTDKQHPRQP